MTKPTRVPAQAAGEAILGRRRELDALRSWFDAARGGAGRLVLCVGEPGIGKTRLAQEFAGRALAGGASVAWGRCVDGEGAPACWAWRQVLRSLAVDPDALISGNIDSPGDRFRVFDDLTEVIRLSPRETEVATLVSNGLTNRQIAERLFISERTAPNHVQHILTKLGFTTRSQIAAWRVPTNE